MMYRTVMALHRNGGITRVYSIVNNYILSRFHYGILPSIRVIPQIITV